MNLPYDNGDYYPVRKHLSKNYTTSLMKKHQISFRIIIKDNNSLLFTGRYFRYRKYRMRVYRVQFWAIFMRSIAQNRYSSPVNQCHLLKLETLAFGLKSKYICRKLHESLGT